MQYIVYNTYDQMMDDNSNFGWILKSAYGFII